MHPPLDPPAKAPTRPVLSRRGGSLRGPGRGVSDGRAGRPPVSARAGKKTSSMIRHGSLRSALKRLLLPRDRLLALAYKNYLLGDPILRRLSELVDPRRTAVDIGAHLGIFTYFLAKKCPRVIAYEPNPDMAELLRLTAAANVEVVCRALSDRAGRATLAVPIIEGRQVHGLGRVKAHDDERPAKCFEVELARLDDEPLENVGFMKIDVEGHEEHVLRGGERLLRRDRPVLLVEIEERHTGKPVAETFGLIERLGYDGYFLRAGKLAPVARFDPARDQDVGNLERPGTAYINNFVFKPRAS